MTDSTATNFSNPFFTYQPTSMAYTAGDFTNGVYNHRSGIILKNKLGKRITGRELSLVYKLPDSQLADFYKHYNSKLGTFLHFDLPSNFSGLFENWCGTALNSDKTKRQVFSKSAKWRYAEPLRVRTLTRGRSELTVVLIDATFLDNEMPSFKIKS